MLSSFQALNNMAIDKYLSFQKVRLNVAIVHLYSKLFMLEKRLTDILSITWIKNIVLTVIQIAMKFY